MIRSLRRYCLLVFLGAVCAAAVFLPAIVRAEGVTVVTSDELIQEINNQTEEITLGADVSTTGTVTIDYPVKIFTESFSWTHNGTMIFTSKDYNMLLDVLSRGAGFLARYRTAVTITGASPTESVIKIRYADGTEDDGDAAAASISESGRMIANILGRKAASWKDILEVTGIVTDGGTYSLGTKNHVLSKEYSITYKTSVTGQETIIRDIDGATSYTEDDQAVTLPSISLKGLKFLGWSLVDGATEYVTEIPAGSTGDKTFYANFEEDPQQGGGSHGGWGGYSFGGLSGLFSSAGTSTADTSASDISDQVQIAAGQPDTTNNGRKTVTGKSRTDVVFSDSSSGSLDLDGVIKTDTKPNRTKQILILGIGLVAASVIGMIALLKKKR
ncbi:MAG: InlB B-repeat-containing protein [Clostridia bacterium]|nr:InlB B-repeat-containing protein [Clostridia bacterium]